MKKLIALALILASVFALCACGEVAPAEPIVTEKIVEVEVEKEVPVIPEEYVPFKDLLDALVAEDYDSAQTILDELKPEPEVPPIVEVEITKDNFFDYFEYVHKPEYSLIIRTDSSGKTTDVTISPAYILKDEFRLAKEKLEESIVDVGVKYKVSIYDSKKTFSVNLNDLTFTAKGKPGWTEKYDTTVKGWYLPLEDGSFSYSIDINNGGASYWLSKNQCQIINEKDVTFVNASGTLYLYE